MKILLINPPLLSRNGRESLFPPLGLGYIASALEKAGYKPTILDVPIEGRMKKLNNNTFYVGMEDEEIEHEIRRIKPDIIGLTCLFIGRFNFVLKIANIAKRIDKNVRVIVGGMHPSSMPKEILKNHSIDFVVLGEGEYTIVELVKIIECNGDYSKLDGLAYKKRGRIFINHKRKFIKNLDVIPFPAFHLFPLEKYFMRQKEIYGRTFLPLSTSRSCSRNCNFCSVHIVHGNVYRARSPQNVVDEIEYLKKRYGIEEINIVDDNFTQNSERAKNIFREIIKRKIKIGWTQMQVEIASCDKELLLLMKKCGVHSINLPLESGDQFILQKIIGKGLSLDKAREIIKLCYELGFFVGINVVLGNIGESKESIKNTINFLSSTPFDSLNAAFAVPLPGTRLYDACVNKKYIKKSIILKSLAKGLRLGDKPHFKTLELSKKDLIFCGKILLRKALHKKIKSMPVYFPKKIKFLMRLIGTKWANYLRSHIKYAN